MSRSQPVHRRPSWAQNDKSYEVYMRSDSVSSRTSSNSADFGVENFSYDPAHIAQWAAPATIMYKEALFPQLMKVEVENWTLSGAALCTALDRIDSLAKEAIHRGWPRVKSFTHFSRQGSVGSPTIAGASDISMSSSPAGSPFILPAVARSHIPTSSTTILTPPSTAESTISPKTDLGSPQASSGAIDSPLVSPTGANTPAYGVQDTKQNVPDLSKLPVELSPHLSPYTPSSGAQTPVAAFDENAWTTYINSYHAELSDIRTRALSRWKGFARTLDRLHVEYGRMGEFQDCMHIFEGWWMPMKVEMLKYEERVKTLRAPDLDQVKKERVDKGLGL